MSLGQKIRELRKLEGLTQRQLAQKIGVSEGQISHYEKDTNKPTLEGLKKMAKVFNVLPSELLKEFSETIVENTDNEIQPMQEENNASDLLEQKKDLAYILDLENRYRAISDKYLALIETKIMTQEERNELMKEIESLKNEVKILKERR
jgi:transcriptional regulator with XRE-family HTH domain